MKQKITSSFIFISKGDKDLKYEHVQLSTFPVCFPMEEKEFVKIMNQTVLLGT